MTGPRFELKRIRPTVEKLPLKRCTDNECRVWFHGKTKMCPKCLNKRGLLKEPPQKPQRIRRGTDWQRRERLMTGYNKDY